MGAQLRAGRGGEELRVADECLRTAARTGCGLGQERPVQVLGERASQVAETVRGVADDDQPARAAPGIPRR